LNIEGTKRLIKDQHMLIQKGLFPRPLCLIGEKGIGKTSIVKEAAKDLGVTFQLLDISSLEPVDFCGVMVPNDEKTKTYHLAPEWVPHTGQGILLIDEVNRAQRDTKPVLLTFLRERRVHAMEMAPGWSVVLAGNPDDGNYEVGEMDDSLKGRMAMIEVVGDRKLTLNYFEKLFLDNPITNWIMAKPDAISFNADSRTDPRSLESLAIRFSGSDINTIDPSHLYSMTAAEIGDLAAGAFMSFYTSGDFLTAEDVLKYYPKNKKRVEKIVTEKRSDLMNALNRSICGALKTQKTLSKANVKNLTEYLEMISVEQLGGFVTQLRTVMDYPSYAKVIAEFKGSQRICDVIGRISKSDEE